MKYVAVLCFFLLLSSSGISQKVSAYSFGATVDPRIQLGMSASEVRNVLGSPTSIQGGFPNSSDLYAKEMPDQVGQLSSSTWFYYYEPIVLKIELPPYEVNGHGCSKSVYDEYKDLSRVYFIDGNVISPYSAESYKQLKDPRLKSVWKDNKTTRSNVGRGKVKRRFRPVLCIIFDRGTSSVAASKLFLLPSDTAK